ncbi:MAG: excinuclease ABC subunit UvrB [Bacteroidales bacterium]|jgi:excinuclease ABC subunit B|nr:excinuclease ABC subunit UvrB [Bacteroidales bacterium]
MNFVLKSQFAPTGDQPQAISQLIKGIKDDLPAMVLQGVTGSGKTFTIANVIKELNRPTLILSHNKTLAAQLYGEFKAFFPDNAVEYFVSYYDYYQPEAYIVATNTYIEKDLSLNDELDRLRLSTTSALLSGRRDVIVVSSVSCLYGIGNPIDFEHNTIHISVGQKLERNAFMLQLVDSLYSRNQVEFTRGKFRVRGDTIDVFPAYGEMAYRISMFGDEVEALSVINPLSGKTIEEMENIVIYPAGNFLTNKETLHKALREIQQDMFLRAEWFREQGRELEAKRLEDRVNNDMEMLQEVGYCSGIENYSRYFDRRKEGERPFCLIDYFPKDFLMVIDESHVTIPQVHAMFGGDRSRKETLVEYGFRLPSAFDNRPLRFEEFCSLKKQTVYVSATPADYEINEAEGIVVEQLIRPTGLLDPLIEIHPAKNQVDDLLEEINIVIQRGERVLVTTLTKRMAEELSRYLSKLNIRNKYIHSDVETLERVEIIRDLREGLFDVLVGVNLLREGLDIPEVSLVAILDADKEGFLRSDRALIQTIGRAARNTNSKAILYGDKITGSMQRAIDENERNRKKQIAYNEANNIIPTQIHTKIKDVIGKHQHDPTEADKITAKYTETMKKRRLILSAKDLRKEIRSLEEMMQQSVKDFDFLTAAKYRDEIKELKKIIPE